MQAKEGTTPQKILVFSSPKGKNICLLTVRIKVTASIKHIRARTQNLQNLRSEVIQLCTRDNNITLSTHHLWTTASR